MENIINNLNNEENLIELQKLIDCKNHKEGKNNQFILVSQFNILDKLKEVKNYDLHVATTLRYLARHKDNKIEIAKHIDFILSLIESNDSKVRKQAVWCLMNITDNETNQVNLFTKTLLRLVFLLSCEESVLQVISTFINFVKINSNKIVMCKSLYDTFITMLDKKDEAIIYDTCIKLNNESEYLQSLLLYLIIELTDDSCKIDVACKYSFLFTKFLCSNNYDILRVTLITIEIMSRLKEYRSNIFSIEDLLFSLLDLIEDNTLLSNLSENEKIDITYIVLICLKFSCLDMNNMIYFLNNKSSNIIDNIFNFIGDYSEEIETNRSNQAYLFINNILSVYGDIKDNKLKKLILDPIIPVIFNQLRLKIKITKCIKLLEILCDEKFDLVKNYLVEDTSCIKLLFNLYNKYDYETDKSILYLICGIAHKSNRRSRIIFEYPGLVDKIMNHFHKDSLLGVECLQLLIQGNKENCKDLYNRTGFMNKLIELISLKTNIHGNYEITSTIVMQNINYGAKASAVAIFNMISMVEELKKTIIDNYLNIIILLTDEGEYLFKYHLVMIINALSSHINQFEYTEKIIDCLVKLIQFDHLNLKMECMKVLNIMFEKYKVFKNKFNPKYSDKLIVPILYLMMNGTEECKKNCMIILIKIFVSFHLINDSFLMLTNKINCSYKTLKDIRIEEFNNFQCMLLCNKNELFLPKNICEIIIHYLIKMDTYTTIGERKIFNNICLSVQDDITKYNFKFLVGNLLFEKKENSSVITSYFEFT